MGLQQEAVPPLERVPGEKLTAEIHREYYGLDHAAVASAGAQVHGALDLRPLSLRSPYTATKNKKKVGKINIRFDLYFLRSYLE